MGPRTPSVSENYHPVLEMFIVDEFLFIDNQEVMKLGMKLSKICKERNLSLSRLAKDAGVPLATMHAWTTGRKSVNPDQLRKVASVLKISMHELIFDEPDPYESLSGEMLKEIFSGDVRVTIHKIERRRTKGF